VGKMHVLEIQIWECFLFSWTFKHKITNIKNVRNL